ncbi:MAG: YgaP family membrane protein [Myxococcota bacterium]
MTCNVGGFDRVLRLILGLIILALGIYFQSYLGLIGLIPLFTAIFKICPLYLPLKFSTCKNTEK